MEIESLVALLEHLAPNNNFAHSLVHGEYGYRKRGYLTENQIAAAERLLAEHREKMRVADDIAKEEDSGIDLRPLPAGRYAVPDGHTRLKVLIRKPGKQSNWHGWIFVSNAAVYGDQQRYGKQAPDSNYQGRIQTQLKAIMANPEAASIEYGKLTGTCGVCGRTLEDEVSVARGIGPVCAAKLGWADDADKTVDQFTQELLGL